MHLHEQLCQEPRTHAEVPERTAANVKGRVKGGEIRNQQVIKEEQQEEETLDKNLLDLEIKEHAICNSSRPGNLLDENYSIYHKNKNQSITVCLS